MLSGCFSSYLGKNNKKITETKYQSIRAVLKTPLTRTCVQKLPEDQLAMIVLTKPEEKWSEKPLKKGYSCKEITIEVCARTYSAVEHKAAENEKGGDENDSEVYEGSRAGYQGPCSAMYSTLMKTINDRITAQGPLLVKDPSMSAADDCLNRLSTALERFQASSEFLQEPRVRLAKNPQSLTQQVAKQSR